MPKSKPAPWQKKTRRAEANDLKISNAFADRIPSLYHFQPYDESYLIDLLETKMAWCSNIANVNDPWDCTMSFKIDDSESAGQTISHLTEIARPTSRGPVADAIRDWALLNDPRILPKVTRLAAEEAYRHAIQWRRMYCLAPCVKSTLMWSHYADKHKGISLQFAVKPDNVFATALKVIYEEEFVTTELFNDSNTAFLPFILKAKCWKYEEEYRLFLRLHDPAAPHPFPEAMHVVDNRFRVPEDTLRAIVLGCCTPGEVGVRIQELVAEHWPSVKIKKMFKEHDRYELELQDFDPRKH